MRPFATSARVRFPSPTMFRSTAVRRALRAALAACATTAGAAAWAQSQEPDDPLVEAPAQVRIGFEKVSLPRDEKMGLVGTTYLVDLGHGLSFGPAVYGAITGRRGGLFTVGAELAWSRRLAESLDLDLGYYAGGGGGGAAPVGGGLMLRPHADLLWDFGPFRAGISWSQVRFPSGDISSSRSASCGAPRPTSASCRASASASTRSCLAARAWASTASRPCSARTSRAAAQRA
jgi:hypothetical protein